MMHVCDEEEEEVEEGLRLKKGEKSFDGNQNRNQNPTPQKE